MQLPTEKEINVYNSLDEICAAEHFLNKTIEEAELLFRKNSIYYQEDLMWMGIKAFDYYMQSAIKYIKSDYSIEDSDFISCMHSTIEFRKDYNDIAIAKNISITFIDNVIDNYNKFEVDEKIYGNLLEKYKALKLKLIKTN